MTGNRPSFSLSLRYGRWLRYAAQQRGISCSKLLEEAIRDLCVKLNISEPPTGWEAARGRGGRPSNKAKSDVDQHFTF